MAKAKEKPKALFAVKADFYASLDNVAQESIMLIQALDMALKHGKIPKPTADILRERLDVFRTAISPSDE